VRLSKIGRRHVSTAAAAIMLNDLKSVFALDHLISPLSLILIHRIGLA